MSEEHLSEAEKKLFEALEKEKAPPKHIEKNIITQLEQEDLIKKAITMSNYMKWAASLAASVLLFMGGMYYERANSENINTSAMIEIEPTKGYILLLHEDANFAPGDPMAMFEEYKSWMENTFNRGVKITGQELKQEATLVKSGTEETFPEDAETKTTGYFLVEAGSLKEAVAVAKENPHVKYGGSVEVKPFMVR